MNKVNTECCGIVWGDNLVKHLREPIRHWRKDYNSTEK